MAPEPIEPSAEVRRRVIGWYDQSLIVHAGALFLANTRQAKDGPPPEALIASTLALPRPSESVAVLMLETVAWALVLHGEFAHAIATLAEAINRAPTNQGLVDLREGTARLLSEQQRRDPSLGIAGSSATVARGAVAEASVRGPTAASLVEINERFAKNVGSDVRALALAA